MKQSAGILLYRRRSKLIEVLLAHPGGPFWKNKDNGVWSIPKGEFNKDEEPLKAALREFEEETGMPLNGKMIELKPVKQKSGKLVRAWAIKGNPDITRFTSNSFSLEWPPKSGRMTEFPEIDRWEWFEMAMARKKILEGQIGILDELMSILKG